MALKFEAVLLVQTDKQSIPVPNSPPNFLFWVTLRARLKILREMAQEEELRMHVKFLARQAS